MNKKHFEIWEKRQQKELESETLKLQEDLAGRGMAQSGIRGQQEKYLKDKYTADIEMERATMEVEEEERKAQKNSRRIQNITNVGLVIIAVASIAAGIWFPLWQESKKQQDDITFLYRSIIANEDIFISNSNNASKFASSTLVADLPENFIEYELNGSAHEALQKQLGIVNYRFLLYYLNQIKLLNNSINQLTNYFITYDKDGDYFYQNAKRIYLQDMDYLNKSHLDTKFNQTRDTECLLFMLQESFPYLEIDKREGKLNCSDESLYRKHYHFGFVAVDTPLWERSKLIKVLQTKGIDISDSFK